MNFIQFVNSVDMSLVDCAKAWLTWFDYPQDDETVRAMINAYMASID